MSTVYVVFGLADSQDSAKWIVGIFADESAANKLCERLNVWLKEIGVHTSCNEEVREQVMRKHNRPLPKTENDPGYYALYEELRKSSPDPYMRFEWAPFPLGGIKYHIEKAPFLTDPSSELPWWHHFEEQEEG